MKRVGDKARRRITILGRNLSAQPMFNTCMKKVVVVTVAALFVVVSFTFRIWYRVPKLTIRHLEIEGTTAHAGQVVSLVFQTRLGEIIARADAESALERIALGETTIVPDTSRNGVPRLLVPNAHR